MSARTTLEKREIVWSSAFRRLYSDGLKAELQTISEELRENH
jgi:hypothetical protein